MLKFSFIGFLGLFIDNGVLLLLKQYTEIWVEIAKLISAEAAIIFNFAANEKYTFKSGKGMLRRFIKSNIVRSGGVLVALAILVLMYNILNFSLLISNTTGIIIGFGFNYTLETLYTWKTHKK